MKKYSVAIIGAGQIGARYDMPNKQFVLSHAHAFSVDSRFDLVGIVDSNDVNLKEASEFWNVPGYVTIDKLFSKNEEIDILVNASPDEVHFRILLEFLKYHNSLVITEKPVTLAKNDALNIKRKYEEAGRTIILNHSRRFISEYISLKERIDNNSFGKFISGSGYYGKGLLHNGTHMIDLLYYFLGAPSRYSELNSFNDYNANDVTRSLIINYDNQTFFTLNGIDSSLVSVFELDLLFERGRIKFLESGHRIEIYEVKESEIHSGYKVYTLTDMIKIDPSSAMKGLTENAFEVMRKKSPKCRIEDGIRVLEIWENLKKR